MNKCIGTTKTGKSCSVPALPDDEYCFFHSQRPEIVAKRAEGRALAGSKRSFRMPSGYTLETLEDIRRMLAGIIAQTSGVSSSNANFTALLRAMELQLKVIEMTEHEQRLAALEDKVGG